MELIQILSITVLGGVVTSLVSYVANKRRMERLLAQKHCLICNFCGALVHDLQMPKHNYTMHPEENTSGLQRYQAITLEGQR